MRARVRDAAGCWERVEFLGFVRSDEVGTKAVVRREGCGSLLSLFEPDAVVEECPEATGIHFSHVEENDGGCHFCGEKLEGGRLR